MINPTHIYKEMAGHRPWISTISISLPSLLSRQHPKPKPKFKKPTEKENEKKENTFCRQTYTEKKIYPRRNKISRRQPQPNWASTPAPDTTYSTSQFPPPPLPFSDSSAPRPFPRFPLPLLDYLDSLAPAFAVLAVADADADTPAPAFGAEDLGRDFAHGFECMDPQ